MKKIFFIICMLGLTISNRFAFGDDHFSWIMFVPSTTGARPCNVENIDYCRNEVDCLKFKGYWYHNSCHEKLILPDIKNENDCHKNGGYWFNNTCNQYPITNIDNIEGCLAVGGYWYNDICNKLPITDIDNEESCFKSGGYWYNDACNQNITCSDITGHYSGTISDNCLGYTVGGKIGIWIDAACNVTSVSQYTVRSNGIITGRQNNDFSGTMKTDPNGCGQFSTSCTKSGTSVSCNYQYVNGRTGSIQNAYKSASKTTNQYLTETLAGNWKLKWKIISDHDDNYYFDISSVKKDPSGSGDYFIYGYDKYNDSVTARYVSKDNRYSIFDPGTFEDMTYMFKYTNSNTVSGECSRYSIIHDIWYDCTLITGSKY